ncbi:MAG: anthranilate phosphoribosyltransferase [Methanomassiliicoccales archaeon]|nr:anthranilate phosphoribosyltransferase [Methanomassiliicoccales archaeon]
MTQTERLIQAQRFASEILNGRMTDRVIADRLQDMGRRGESAEEMLGITNTFYGLCNRLPTVHPMVMDVCGTGGAAVRSFNVSTISAFVLAAAGVPVAKHGNRSSQGQCGSADLLEAMGADISPGPERSAQMLDSISFTFLFAPAYHPAMRHVAKARRLVSDRTIFNVIGPLMNPVLGPRRQLMGVCSPELLETVPPVLRSLGVDRAMVVHGLPGMDEVSLCGSTLVAELKGEDVERYEICPEEQGLKRCHEDKVRELTPQASVRVCIDLLRGKTNERRDMVLFNCACALYVFGSVSSIAAGLSLAERVIDGGNALSKMQHYILASNGREAI